MEDNKATLKVMTFNIRFANDTDPYIWQNRKENIVQIIKKYQPDVIGFQEVIDIQYDFLSKELQDYSSYGVYRDETPNSEMSPIFIHQALGSIEISDTFWLSETPRQKASIGWDAHLPRVASLVKLKSQHDGWKNLIFINTHLDHIGSEARKQSMLLLKQTYQTLSEKYQADIMMTGDFNAFPDEMVTLINDSDLKSIYDHLQTKEGNQLLTCHQYQDEIIGQPIDYIIMPKDFEIINAQIIRDKENNIFPSDHYPVLVEIRKNS